MKAKKNDTALKKDEGGWKLFFVLILDLILSVF